MNRPTFSILTPTYNCAQFILRSYHSLISQTKSDWEWVIVNDGSLDNTEEIINSINDNRIKFHTYEKNRGRGYARNLGLSKCEGNVVVVWDIDDLYLPARLHRIYETILVQNYDFMVSQAIVVDNFFNFKSIRGFSQSKLMRGFVHPTLAFKSELVKEINYDKTMSAGEDLLVMIMLSNGYNGKYLDENLMVYFEDREVNLLKTRQMHKSHTITIQKVLDEKLVNISALDSLIIKATLLLKKIVLNMFMLRPSFYLLTVKFRNKKSIAIAEEQALSKIINDIKKQYSKL